MGLLAEGTTQINGTQLVQILVPEITATNQILFTNSTGNAGIIVRTEITPGEGFGISSTNPDDQGTVGWQVWE
jgi:hypothetical protein